MVATIGDALLKRTFAISLIGLMLADPVLCHNAPAEPQIQGGLGEVTKFDSEITIKLLERDCLIPLAYNQLTLQVTRTNERQILYEKMPSGSSFKLSIYEASGSFDFQLINTARGKVISMKKLMFFGDDQVLLMTPKC